jgi:alanine dehydrogenase
MIVGVAREIKEYEYRVAMTPQGAARMVHDGHTILVEQGAGQGSGFADADYLVAGAFLVDRKALFAEAEMLVKVKEPLPAEYPLLRPGQILFAYLHLAPNPLLTETLIKRGITAFAYETLERDGHTPLLTPMSEIAGRMAPLMGCYFLQRPHGGTGLLPSGVSGVGPARAVIIGAGIVGQGAAFTASGIGMATMVLNRGADRLREIDQLFRGTVKTRLLTPDALREEIATADLVVGALYATGSRTPVVISRDMLGSMKPGAVIVDVAIDQGGCAETSRPTTHDSPVFTVDGIIHYCVANMPGAYPRTSTEALTNATLPYIRQLARQGADAAATSTELSSALNIKEGAIIHKGVAAAASTAS